MPLPAAPCLGSPRPPLRSSGLPIFEAEGALQIEVDGVALQVLPLERVIASKRAANRDKDRAALPSLETALVVKQETNQDE